MGGDLEAGHTPLTGKTVVPLAATHIPERIVHGDVHALRGSPTQYGFAMGLPHWARWVRG